MKKMNGYEYGAQRLQNSINSISCKLNIWNYEENGEPTPEKLAKLIPMGINTVNKHFKHFAKKIEEINNIEKNRLEEIEYKDRMRRERIMKSVVMFKK
jgi:hypothetical protein